MVCLHKTLLLNIFILLSLSGSALDLSKVDFSHLYQPGKIKMNYQIAKEDSLYSLAMAFTYQHITQSQELIITLHSQEKFNTNKDSEISIINQESTNQVDGEYDIYNFTVDEKHNHIVIKVYFNNLPYIYNIPIQASLAIKYPDFITSPIDHINTGDTILCIESSNKTIYSFEYQHDFETALPPFVLNRSTNSTQKKLEIVNKHLVNNTFIASDTPTLYLLQSDTTGAKGHRILTHRASFPKPQTIEELIEPLIFITTQKEANTISNNEDKKKAFEEFWLNNIPDKPTAARTIKEYYKRISLANSFFTSFKIGWKTDQGMIVTIFGSPTRVSRKHNKEIWTYSTFKGDIQFTFAKQTNIFDHSYYILERDDELTEVWFNEVKKWRNGDI